MTPDERLTATVAADMADILHEASPDGAYPFALGARERAQIVGDDHLRVFWREVLVYLAARDGAGAGR